MAEVIAIAAIPNLLKGTWAVLKAAYGIHESIDMRKTQIRLLLDRCQDLVVKIAKHSSMESETALSPSMRTGIEDLQETCQEVLDLLEKARKKGFLWCIINQSNIDSHILDVESRLTSTFEIFNFIAHVDRDRFQQDMRLALKEDHADLVAKLNQLSANDQRILDALQEHGGMQRRLEELLVAVHKCIENIGSEQSPEAKFLRKADTALHRMSQGRPQMISEDWIVTSLEVDFDTINSIGQGSFGRVYKGQWHAALVAIKQMYFDDARTLTEKSRKMMYKEVKLWTALHHPNILNLYGACLEATMPFLVMQYCRFGNLCQYLLTNPNANRINLSYDIMAGMTYLHSRGIVHADLKGVNILVDDNQNALVADFGLSQAIDGIRSQSGHSTKAGARGTLRWMAPECLDGEPVTKASDVYSLGLTIWEIFSDEVPFANIADRVIPRHVVDRQQRPARPSRLELDTLWRLVQSCWAHKPVSRPSMSALQRSLARYTSKLDSSNLNASPSSANPIFNNVPDEFPSVMAPASTPPTPRQVKNPVELKRNASDTVVLHSSIEISTPLNKPSTSSASEASDHPMLLPTSTITPSVDRLTSQRTPLEPVGLNKPAQSNTTRHPLDRPDLVAPGTRSPSTSPSGGLLHQSSQSTPKTFFESSHTDSPLKSPQPTRVSHARDSGVAASRRREEKHVDKKMEKDKRPVDKKKDPLWMYKLLRTFNNPEWWYHDLVPIGRGASSDGVYTAYRNGTDRLVTIKRIKQPKKDLIINLLNHNVCDLQHTNIVEFLHTCIYVDELWLVVEHMEGGSLKDVISANKMTEGQTAAISREVAQGLHYLHENEVFLGGIKSDSVLLSKDGGIKLITFGFCAQMSDSAHTANATTYCKPPEVVNGKKNGPKVDVWCLGIIAVEMIKGELTYLNETSRRVLNGTPKIANPENMSRTFDDYLTKTLEVDVDRRPTAVELLQHPFFKLSKPLQTLKPLIEVARENAKHK